MHSKLNTSFSVKYFVLKCVTVSATHCITWCELVVMYSVHVSHTLISECVLFSCASQYGES